MTVSEEVNLEKILPSNGPSIQEVKKYLNKYKNEYIIIKIGGACLNDEPLFKILIEDISILKKMNFNPILVHGGGKRLTAKLNQLNIESKFVGGLRVSNKDVVKIAQDVFIEFNKEILNEIKNHSVSARSITSKENNIINVKAISEELGFVGTPYKIDADVLTKIVKANEIPIIAPLGLNSENQVYNVNADDIATFVASSLNARRLIIISDVVGVMDKDNNLISEINSIKVKEMIERNEISGGMQVKLNSAINIADKVKGTVIISGKKPRSLLFELLSDKGSGTLIRK